MMSVGYVKTVFVGVIRLDTLEVAADSEMHLRLVVSWRVLIEYGNKGVSVG